MVPKGTLLHSQRSIISMTWARSVQATNDFLNTNFNIIFLSVPRSSSWFLSLRFPTKTLYAPLSVSSVLASWPAHLMLLDLMKNTNHEAANCAVLSSHLLLCSSLAQVSSSASYSQTPLNCVLPPAWQIIHKANGKITVFYILIIIFLETKREDGWSGSGHSQSVICP